MKINIFVKHVLKSQISMDKPENILLFLLSLKKYIKRTSSKIKAKNIEYVKLN